MNPLEFNAQVEVTDYSYDADMETVIVHTALVKTATGIICTSATSVTVNFTGTFIGAFAVMSGSMVIVDVAPSSSSVTFSVAAAPSAAVTCTVVYI